MDPSVAFLLLLLLISGAVLKYGVRISSIDLPSRLQKKSFPLLICAITLFATEYIQKTIQNLSTKPKIVLQRPGDYTDKIILDHYPY